MAGRTGSVMVAVPLRLTLDLTGSVAGTAYEGNWRGRARREGVEARRRKRTQEQVVDRRRQELLGWVRIAVRTGEGGEGGEGGAHG